MTQFFASGCQGIGSLYSGQSIRFFLLLIFPHLESQNKNVLFLELSQGLNDTMHVKHLAQSGAKQVLIK